jgi:two-component system chemotaxis response regulator CheB
MNKSKALVIGASAGGLDALDLILIKIPEKSKVPVFIVQHISPDSDSYFISSLKKGCKVNVKEAQDTEEIVSGTVYFAPPDYHLYIDTNNCLKLSHDGKVNYSRPSIDVLFETAAEYYGKQLIGILLTGSNSDGSKGLKRIKDLGGTTIVQLPATAHFSEMPASALKLLKPDFILTLEEIAIALSNINVL